MEKPKRLMFWGNPKLVKGCWHRQFGFQVSYFPSSGVPEPSLDFRFNLFIYFYWATLCIRLGRSVAA